MTASFQTTTCTMYLVRPITSSHLNRQVMHEIIPISLEYKCSYLMTGQSDRRNDLTNRLIVPKTIERDTI